MMRNGPLLLAAWMLCLGGCATRGNVDILENQLRQQEDQLFALNSQLDQAESELALARREVDTLRTQLAERGQSAPLPEHIRSFHRIAGVRVNRLFSGGLNRDQQPGDELLNVVLVPHDEHGETVKIPGHVELEVLDLAAPSSSRQLGVWQFSAEEVAERWQSGLISGFQFRIPWRKIPSSNEVLIQARFATPDGRQFDTASDVRVKPAPGSYPEVPSLVRNPAEKKPGPLPQSPSSETEPPVRRERIEADDRSLAPAHTLFLPEEPEPSGEAHVRFPQQVPSHREESFTEFSPDHVPLPNAEEAEEPHWQSLDEPVPKPAVERMEPEPSPASDDSRNRSAMKPAPPSAEDDVPMRYRRSDRPFDGQITPGPAKTR